jgi:carbohydrate-selective porin OprB
MAARSSRDFAPRVRARQHCGSPIVCASRIPSRALDQFGIGYYYSSVNNPTFQHPLFTRTFLRDEWGFEAYYNVALTPWLLLTPDVQVIGPSQEQQTIRQRSAESVGTATVLGVRGQLIF